MNNEISNEISNNEISNSINLLDPLSVIIKLAILSKKQIGCKFSICNNIIYIQELGVFQSIVRYYYKDNKIDIQYLYNPIQFACLNFLNHDFIKKHPNIVNIFINAQKGIQNLIQTYSKFTIITHTLYMYYNLIANHLGDSYNNELFIKDNMTELYTNTYLSNLYAIWHDARIKIVLDIINFIDNDHDPLQSVKCLEEFMIIIDNQIQLIFKQ